MRCGCDNSQDIRREMSLETLDQRGERSGQRVNTHTEVILQ